MITVVLLALLFLRALRREPMERSLERTETVVTDIRSALNPPDAVLVGPREQRFAGQAQGDMVWFHVCLLMFKPNRCLADVPLDPMVIHSIRAGPEPETAVGSRCCPKLQECRGHRKVRPPA